MTDKPIPTGDGVPLHSMAHPGNPFDTLLARIAAILTGGYVDRESEEKAREILNAMREPPERVLVAALSATDLPTTERLREVWHSVLDIAAKDVR